MEIGLKEPISSGLSVPFFSRGRTNACFKVSGKKDSLNDVLHISASTDDSNGSRRLSSQVGIGSKEQCLDGAKVVDFLLALIELFSLGVTAEELRAIIGSKSAISLQRGSVDPKFYVEGVVPHQPFFFSVN